MSSPPSPQRWTRSWLRSLPEAQQTRLLASLTAHEKAALYYRWPFWARPDQLIPPRAWRTWLLLAGRGFGKTRTGAEGVRAWVETGTCKRIALVAPTAGDARDVMVEGESGVLAVCSPWLRPVYEPSKRRVTWPNGAIATLYSAEEPDRLRGPQHDGAWCDELAAWRQPQATWDMLQMGLRLGRAPKQIVTTTPRPIPLIKELLKAADTVTTRGSTYANKENLAAPFLTYVLNKYEGTRLGRQELGAEILEDTPGALWTRGQIEATRVTTLPDLIKIGVGVDPSATSGGDEAGIIVAGVDANGHGYVLDDLSVQGSPVTWAKAAVQGYTQWDADRLIAEANQGGEMVAVTISTIPGAPPVKLVHASRGKHTRAEPVSALYAQGRVHHLRALPKLEDEMTTWVPGDASPNRMDALVWILTDLLLGDTTGIDIMNYYRAKAKANA